ncbi:unnamed protein product [Pleuronectes platessa]|uniref:Uncharacterized protein n=1 Tax=Pleuronectes platessa TaxID=8262 RepID=A0A9N7U2I7_PLEPL|nr:unnamed protein product [Pleuronectes platessa]
MERRFVGARLGPVPLVGSHSPSEPVSWGQLGGTVSCLKSSQFTGPFKGDGSEGLPIPRRESDAGAETAGARGGQKCSIITPPPHPRTPCLGLQKQDRLPQCSLPFCEPPRAPPDSSGIQDRDPTRSTAGRRISTILRFALLIV